MSRKRQTFIRALGIFTRSWRNNVPLSLSFIAVGIAPAITLLFLCFMVSWG
jgi:ABC-type multidrug transport system permease subunit